ncbi:hypothetical protein A245_38699, partial [Pseudomonas syringae pv. actinidiae ICMP 19096]
MRLLNGEVSSTAATSLRLEGDLRAAKAVGARQLPALDWHQTVGGASAEYQRVVFDHAVHALAGAAQFALREVPGQRVRAIVDLVAQAV